MILRIGFLGPSSQMGPAKAVTATAHKLAILIYRMLKYAVKYVEQGRRAYEQQYQQQNIQVLVKRSKQMGHAIVDLASREVVS